MVASAIVYLGLCTMLVGLLALVRPMRTVGLPTRRRAALGLAAGVCIAAIGSALPAATTRVVDMPIMDVATRTGFMVLADDPPREFVVGTVVLAPDDWRRSDAPTPAAFAAIRSDGFATAVMNFRIVPDGTQASRLTTETRVFATDVAARRRFAVYWRVIYPGSALIRRMWLRAIGRRATRAPGS